MDDLLRLGKQVLASQPFSTLVGAELTGFLPGWAELDEDKENLCAVSQGTIARIGKSSEE